MARSSPVCVLVPVVLSAWPVLGQTPAEPTVSLPAGTRLEGTVRKGDGAVAVKYRHRGVWYTGVLDRADYAPIGP